MKYAKILYLITALAHLCYVVSTYLLLGSKENAIADLLLILFVILYTLSLIIYFYLIRRIFQSMKDEVDSTIAVNKQHILHQQEAQQLKIGQLQQYRNDTAAEQLLTLKKHLLEDNPQLALETLTEYRRSHTQISLPIYCSNSIVNAVLYNKYILADEHNISVNYQVLLPSSMSLSPTLVSSLFFNLLDNAIYACGISGSEHPFINIRTRFRANYLHIYMCNSKSVRHPFVSSSSNDGQPTGLGLSIIEQITEDNDGHCQWIDKGDVFESIVLLQY